MDYDEMTTLVAAIPEGAWMSYADVAFACGGNVRHARLLNQRFVRDEVKNAHRVLKSDGTIAPTALGAPETVRAQLVSEGIVFEGGRASAEQRMRPPGAEEREAEARAEARRHREKAAAQRAEAEATPA
jgi:alkylated DNA nucleotide flippase Atl1